MVGGSPLDISLFGHPLLLNSAASASEEDLSENDNMYDGGDDNHSQGPETIGSGVGDRHGPPDHLATPRRSGGEKQHYQKVPLEPKSSWRPSDRLSCENSHTTREWATQPSDCPRPTSGARRGFAPAGTSVFLLGDHCLSRARAVSGTLEDSMRNAPKDPAPSEIGATMHDLCPLQESIRFSDDDGGSRFDHAKTYSTLPMRPKARRTEQHDILDPPYTSDTSALNVDAPITWMT